MKVTNERMNLAERFRSLTRSFGDGGAWLYWTLAMEAADELEAGTSRFAEVLMPWAGEPVRRLMPLRLFAAVHGWVLAGELPDLAQHYRSVDGMASPSGAWPKFRDAVVDRAEELPALLEGTLQHNEPTRAGALTLGFLLLVRENRLPLRVLEVGASAGLLLLWDQYRPRWWFRDLFLDSPPLGGWAEVAERRGCDLSPIDPALPENRLRLTSYVWADLPEHRKIMDEAIEIAGRMPATVDQADGAVWLREQLATPRPGVTTVVFHSMMRASGPQESLSAMAEVLAEAGARATDEAPLAHLRFEPTTDSWELETGPAGVRMETRLMVWPGPPPGYERVVASQDVNGRRVRHLL